MDSFKFDKKLNTPVAKKEMEEDSEKFDFRKYSRKNQSNTSLPTKEDQEIRLIEMKLNNLQNVDDMSISNGTIFMPHSMTHY